MSTIAQFTYTIPPINGSRPYITINENPTTGIKEQNWISDVRSLEVEDVRGKEHDYTLDICGFQFHRHPTEFTRFSNDKEIRSEYYRECEELLKELTGAARVVAFDHTIRRRRPDIIDDSVDKRKPVPVVHGDRTPASSDARVRKHLPPSEAEERLQGRFQIINLWRPISNPVLEWPLAACDYRSIDPENELLTLGLVQDEHVGENYHLKYSPKHRWFYKSNMDLADVLLLKCHDSISDDSVAKLAAHSAFEDPKAPKDAPLRESIEVEVLLFYEDEVQGQVQIENLAK